MTLDMISHLDRKEKKRSYKLYRLRCKLYISHLSCKYAGSGGMEAINFYFCVCSSLTYIGIIGSIYGGMQVMEVWRLHTLCVCVFL